MSCVTAHLTMFVPFLLSAFTSLRPVKWRGMRYLVTVISKSLYGCRAWNILGLAIRMGQSIGLHVEDSPTENTIDPIQQEMRRRAWYSLYVLDRLLALQLGRPVAIHETEYHVSLPSEMADIDSDSANPGNGSVLNYFIQVIHFSQIVGSAITLYLQTHSEESLTSHTARLDKSLLDWMTNLPRQLRFDLGHTFEKGGVFKKQVHQDSRSLGFVILTFIFPA
jgi:hypothetical protein